MAAAYHGESLTKIGCSADLNPSAARHSGYAGCEAAGVNLSFGQQLLMMLTLMLTSKGVAGVPRAALVILAGTLSTFHLPMEGVAVLLGIDALMDMARTSVNVVGNCLASAVVARWEGA